MNDIPQTIIGVDLGDNKHHYCVLDQAGKLLSEGTLPNTREALSDLAVRYPGARVAIEVGTHPIEGCLPRRDHRLPRQKKRQSIADSMALHLRRCKNQARINLSANLVLTNY